MNRSVAVVTMGLLVVGSGCEHTKSTERTSPSEAEQKTGERKPASSEKSTKENATTGTGGIPVASSPEGLLVPGAEKQIRDKLGAAGYLKEGEGQSMQAALRRFQKARDLPETGLPDHKTVQSLGLDPERIFKHGEASPSDHQ
jgi:hypothetical protein